MMDFRFSARFVILAVLAALAACKGSGGMVPAMHGPSQMSHMPPPMSMAMPRSTSPALIAAAPMASTAILPAGAMMSVSPSRVSRMSVIQGLNWSVIPGSASQVAASPDGSLWALSTQPAGPDKYIWHYVSGSWTNISGLAAHLAVAKNDTLYAVNSGGGTYAYSGGTWSALGGGASAITVAADGSIYVLSNGGTGDQAIWHNVSGVWSQVPGAGVALGASWDMVNYSLPGGTVSSDGFYVLNSLGNIYYENTGGSFAQLPGAASAIAPTISGGAFALGYPASADGDTIYYYDLNSPGWTAEGGAGISLSANSTNLYVVGASSAIYSSPVVCTPPCLAAAYPLPDPPWGIAAGPDGNMWFTEGGGTISRITPSGALTDYSVPTANSAPTGIATGPDGNLWFTEVYGNNIGKITPNGVVTEYPIPTASSHPEDITAGPDGNLWFTEGADNIGKITPNGVVTEYPVPTANSAPTDIAAGPDGNLWFTEEQGNKIGKITPSGTITEYPVPITVNEPYGSNPWGIAAGPDGNLWFTEATATEVNSTEEYIGKITPNGVVTEYAIPTATPEALGITAGPDGNMWFTEWVQGKIGKITTSGVVTEYLVGGTGPFDIAAGPDGNLWFTELPCCVGQESSNQIGKFSP